MSTASRFVLAGVIAVACVVLFAGGALTLANTAFTRTDHRSRVLRGDVARVVVATGSGDVTLRSGATGRVTVAERRRFWLRKPKVDVALRDGVLAIRVHCGHFGPSCSDDLDVTVPAGVGRTSVDADSGAVSVSGMRGAVDLRADSGDVEAEDIVGALTLSADSGDVRAREVRAETVSASADSGDVDVTLLAPARAVSASANSGDVTVDVPAGRYRVDAGADSGDVSVDGLLRDDSAARHIGAHADSGDVTVRGR
jgi:Putative adhesin